MTQAGPVLLVEDDADVRALLAELLRRRGFAVDTVANGAEAITAFEAGARPRAVLTDLCMPGLVGNEVIEYMRSSPELAAIPVAVVSGIPRGAPVGYTVFTKPVDVEILTAFLRRVIRA